MIPRRRQQRAVRSVLMRDILPETTDFVAIYTPSVQHALRHSVYNSLKMHHKRHTSTAASPRCSGQLATHQGQSIPRTWHMPRP